MILNWQRRPQFYRLAGENHRIPWPKSAGLAQILFNTTAEMPAEWPADVDLEATLDPVWLVEHLGASAEAYVEWPAQVPTAHRVTAQWLAGLDAAALLGVGFRGTSQVSQALRVDFGAEIAHDLRVLITALREVDAGHEIPGGWLGIPPLIADAEIPVEWAELPYGTPRGVYTVDERGNRFLVDRRGQVYGIDPEGRTYVVGRRDRVYQIDPRGNVYWVGTRGRRYSVDTEGRTYRLPDHPKVYGAERPDTLYSADQRGTGVTEPPRGRTFRIKPRN